MRSAVREPGRSWSERIVPFIPRTTSNKLNKREGWFLAWWMPDMDDAQSASSRYALVKINKEVTEEYQRRKVQPP
jgi:hypothetical protein